MAEFLWKKIGYLSGMAAIGVLIGLVVFLCNFEISDFDLWLHLKTGEVIVEQGFIPTTDIFSCTVAGQPWNNHEWLFQVIFYLFLSFGGYDGLFTAQAIIVALTLMTLLFLSDIRHRHYFTVFLLFLLTLVYQSRLTMRPDLFSLFFFAFYLYALAMHLEKKATVWILFAMQILWVNIHGFFIFGPLLILLSMICEWTRRHVPLPWQWNTAGRLTDQELGRLKFAFVATLLACLVNPQFIKGAVYPFQIIFQMSGESSIFFSHIQELKKPISFATLFTQQYIYYKVLILLSFYSFVVNRRRIDISALLLWIIFLIFSLQAIRNMVFFGIVAYLTTILNLSEHSFEDIAPVKFKRRVLKLITIALFNILLILWMVRFGYEQTRRVAFNFKTYEMESSFGMVNKRNFPWDAADFINKNGLQGNFFNDFNSGAFLVGRCTPQIRLFIDGRTELYGPKFFKEYIRIWDEGDCDAFLKAVNKYKLIGAFLNSARNHINPKMLQHLYQDKDWALVYLDHDAVIFLKDVEENKELIKKFRKDKNNIVYDNFDLERLGSRGVFPYREIKRAYHLETIGLDDLALGQVQDALWISPGSSEPYYIRGKIFKKKGKNKEAFRDFRVAVMISPDDNDARRDLASIYFALGNYSKAITEYEALLKREQKTPDVFFQCAKAYLEDGQNEKAVAVWRKGFSLKKNNVAEALKVADAFAAKERYTEAFELYVSILKANPREAEVYHKIGVCFEGLKEFYRAKEAFLRGLRIDPTSTTLRKASQGLKHSSK